MNNFKNKVWPITAGIIFALTTLMTAGLVIKVAGLDMLPMKYLGLAILAVVFLLALIFAFFFLLPWKKKVKAAEAVETTEENTAKKRNIGKYVLRTIGMILAIALVVVDIAGIQVINDFEETISNVVQDDEEEKVEEFVIGVYVRVDDKAESLEDAKRYDFGYSLAYDRNNTRKAIGVMETELDRSLNLEEYSAIPTMVDAVLAEEKDAFILSTAYMTILEEQEGYTDISDKVKCIHECVVTTETELVQRGEKAFEITQDPFLVYISGTDTRGSGLQNVRNDVNILAAVNPTTKQVLLINTPRDYYVEISVSNEGERDKLTHCGIYGIDCSLETLENLYDEDIRFYTQINFKGFTRLIDALGGVTVYSSKSLYTTEGHFYIEKGKNVLNGEEALAYARDRFSYADGDSARGRNQMDIIKGIIDKLSSGALLTNYTDILDSMGRYFACNLSETEISSLVKMQLGDMAKWNVQTFTVTGQGKSSTTYSMPTLKSYVMVPDETSVDFAKTLIGMVFDGEIIEKEDLTVPVVEEVETESKETTEDSF